MFPLYGPTTATNTLSRHADRGYSKRSCPPCCIAAGYSPETEICERQLTKPTVGDFTPTGNFSVICCEYDEERKYGKTVFAELELVFP